MTLEEASGPPVEVWPDNAVAVYVFENMDTQWRVGYTGLDYNALPAVMRLCKVPPGDRADVFASIRTLEDAAMKQIRKSK